MTDVKKVAILGGTGFVGMELFRILNFHKGFEVHFISSESKAGKPIINQHLWENKIKYKSINELDGNYDAIFSCLPSGALPKHINNVINKAKVIFNVSGDYRIKEKKVSSEYYPSTDWSALDVNVQYYIPEFHVLDKKSKIINLPGCMAVSSIYAIYPLLKNNLIENEGIILDIKTGSSGGGKNTAETHAERFNNFRLHKAFKHKHQPEIEKYLNEISSRRNNINFTSYSLDIPRGIYVSAYSRLKDGVTDVDVKKAFFREYKGKEFIKYFSNINSINIKNVLGSNSSHTSFKINNNICLSVSTIDNLVKGAAGQAIQAANIYFEYNEHEGLETPKGVLWP